MSAVTARKWGKGKHWSASYSGAADFFLSTPHVELFNFNPSDRGGGVPDTVPSLKRHHISYIKRTQGTVESRPPLPCLTQGLRYPSYICANVVVVGSFWIFTAVTALPSATRPLAAVRSRLAHPTRYMVLPANERAPTPTSTSG